MINVAETDSDPDERLLMCGWRRRGKTAKALARYRRHWRQDHGNPFMAETEALMRWMVQRRQAEEWGTGAEIQVTASKGHDDG